MERRRREGCGTRERSILGIFSHFVTSFRIRISFCLYCALTLDFSASVETSKKRFACLLLLRNRCPCAHSGAQAAFRPSSTTSGIDPHSSRLATTSGPRHRSPFPSRDEHQKHSPELSCLQSSLEFSVSPFSKAHLGSSSSSERTYPFRETRARTQLLPATPPASIPIPKRPLVVFRRRQASSARSQRHTSGRSPFLPFRENFRPGPSSVLHRTFVRLQGFECRATGPCQVVSAFRSNVDRSIPPKSPVDSEISDSGRAPRTPNMSRSNPRTSSSSTGIVSCARALLEFPSLMTHSL